MLQHSTRTDSLRVCCLNLQLPTSSVAIVSQTVPDPVTVSVLLRVTYDDALIATIAQRAAIFYVAPTAFLDPNWRLWFLVQVRCAMSDDADKPHTRGQLAAQHSGHMLWVRTGSTRAQVRQHSLQE